MSMKRNSPNFVAARKNRGAARRYVLFALAGIALAGFGVYRLQARSSSSRPSSTAEAASPASSTSVPADVAQPDPAHPVSPVADDERTEAYRHAIAKGAAESTAWPATPEALIRDFWNAAARKDYDRMVLLCPGSVKSDFKTYYDQWTPSAATAIGAPQTHSADVAVHVYPVTVPFPGFPKKTIKMAVRRAGDGRLVIDGRYTIWW